MTSAVAGAAGAAIEFVLKATPPKAPRHMLARPLLSSSDEHFLEHRLIVVQASAGFGKTTLLSQWRREYLSQGAAVAWLQVDDRDDPPRFLHGLVHAVRVGAARPAFGRGLIESPTAAVGELEGVTAWLAEVATSALDMVLIIDEAERLPAASRLSLAYLLHNAPRNLRIVVAARSGLDDIVSELGAYGQCVLVGAEALRFRLNETIALVRGRLGNEVEADTCAQLHELTEGWPLGLQLTLAAMERGSTPRSVVSTLSGSSGDLRSYLVDELISRLPPDDVQFLIRISIVDKLHPELCVALTGREEAAAQLAGLVRNTPIFVDDEVGQWCRLHMLARDALRLRFAQLPEDERARLHLNAVQWLSDNGMVEEAARHAYSAGQHGVAYDLAERCLYDAVRQGQQLSVLEWLERLPEAELDRRPRLRLAVAWVLARSERQAEAEAQVERILAHPGIDDALRYECALILSAAEYFADRPYRFVELFEPWAKSPPSNDPWLLQIHANRLSARAILNGDYAQARRHQQQMPTLAVDRPVGYVVRWGGFLVGLSYLLEGQYRLAESVLRQALQTAEVELGRRNPLSCMLAALLAAAVYERDQLDEAASLLANRLDVLERAGVPETVAYAYRTASRIAAAQGVEHRALDLLEAMYATGTVRDMPRLCVGSLAEQVRIHAGRFRSETCRALVQRIDDIMAQEVQQGPVRQKMGQFLQQLSHANMSIAAQDWKNAQGELQRAGQLADEMKLGRYRIETMALRAFVMDQHGEDGLPLLREAVNLAQTYGLARTLVDAHPALGDWVRRVAEDGESGGLADDGQTVRIPRTMRPQLPQKATTPRAVPSMVLTPRERDLLEQLARGLSNKEIAMAMAVSEETVKWHLKNLFGKLDAGSRKQVVRRAQLLGLLEGGD